MKIASIDIGTNAIKSKIFVTSPTAISFIEAIRSPIRLGEEVFNDGKLSKAKLNELISTLKQYQKTFEKKQIVSYEITATSAFRDTKNSEDARRYVENRIEHPIRIISGLEEAKLISLHPKAQTGTGKMFVDVGGGSTEIYVYKEDKHLIQSFQLGGVRLMLKKDKKNEWSRLEEWIKKQTNINTITGLGGNIRAFLSIHNVKKMSSNEFIKKASELRKLSVDEKITLHNLSHDRADVIDHGLKIFLKIINGLQVKKIKSTKWGVSDSIAVKSFHELYSKKISINNN
ncbi:MAG: phosphatase [Pseudomonadota bacterium]|nr:phosphatase [Pseudomonadota bacterium]